MPYVGELGSAGLAKESTLGTFVAPTEFLPFIPPLNFGSPDITLIESKGIRQSADSIQKVAQGPGLLKSGKIKFEVEPENIGNTLMAAFGTDAISGPTSTSVYTHAFTRIQSAQLPSYSWWLKPAGTLTYPQYSGCMLNKLTIEAKAKEFVMADADWVGLKYVSGGATHASTYSTHQPFKFDQAVVKIPSSGGAVNNYEDIKLTLDNMVSAEHVLSGSIYAGKIYSKGLKVSLSANIVVEDVTEWTNFINGTASSFNLALTSSENIPASSPSTPYSLTFDMPTMNYTAAPMPIGSGLIKIAFSAVGVYTAGSTKTISASLLNSISAAY